MARKSDISLRLTTQGKEDLKRALRETGEEGRKMADQLDRAGKKGSRSLKAIDETAKEARGGLEGLTQELGPLGAGLRALGPLGLAAGASAGALALGFGAAVRIGKEAVDTFAEIGNSADRMGLAVETSQALTAEFAAQGIEISRLDTGMAALAERQAQIADEQGELYSRLKDTNPELLAQLQGLESNEDRLRAVTKALQEAETQTDRNRIAYAAFGEAGRDILRVLMATEGGIDGLIDKGKELGLVMDEDLIRRSQTLSTEFDITAKVLDLQLKAAFVDFGPVALQMVTWLADIASMANRVADNFRDAADRSSEFNQDKLIELGDSIARRAGGGDPYADAMRTGRELRLSDFDTKGMRHGNIRNLKEDIEAFNALFVIEMKKSAEAARAQFNQSLKGLGSEALRAELDAIQKQIDTFDEAASVSLAARFEREGIDPSSRTDEANRIREDDAYARLQRGRDLADRKDVVEELLAAAEAREAHTDSINAERAAKEAAAEADRKAKEDAQKLLALQREAAAVLGELGDYTEMLADKEQRLKEMVDAKLISQEQADKALQAYSDEIKGVTEAVSRWTDVVSSGRSPVEGLREQVKGLKSDLKDKLISLELYTAAYQALKKAIKEAEKAEREATDEFKGAADIKRQLAEAAAARMSFDESLAAERARVKDLVKSKELTSAEADDWLELYTKKLREVRREVDLWAEAESILDGVQQGRIRTIEDVGRALAATLLKIIQASAQAEAAAGTSQGFGSFLSNVFGRMAGMFGFGGGGGGGGSAAATSGPAATVPSHSGSVVGTPARERRPASMRLAGDERVRVVRANQEIVTDADRRKLIEYIEGTQRPPPPAAGAMAMRVAPLDINLVTRDESGGRASVTAQRTGQGGLDLKVVFRDEVRGMAGRGELDDALQGRGFRKDAPR